MVVGRTPSANRSRGAAMVAGLSLAVSLALSNGRPPRHVLVQREMESGRAPLESITPNSRGSSHCRKPWRPGGRGQRPKPLTGFTKRNQVGWSHSQRVALRSGNQLATKRILNIRAAKLLNKQPCRRHHAGAIPAEGVCKRSAPCFSFWVARDPSSKHRGT